MGWLWLVGSFKLYVSFAKEPYKRDNILQKRPKILSTLLTVANPYGAATLSRLLEIKSLLHNIVSLIGRVCARLQKRPII